MPEDWKASAKAWIDWVDGGDPNRNHLLDPILRELADAKGRRVLDVGCGEGRFARLLEFDGATVFGVDPVPTFAEHARARGEKARFAAAQAEALPFADGVFDLVVSYLTLIDIPDYQGGIAEMARVLRPGGRLLLANLNPFVTTRPYAWEEDDRGNKLFVPVDDYFVEKANRSQWHGIDVVNYHRPMTAYMEALIGAGLTLRHFSEPRPTPAAIRDCPRLESGLRVPFFHVMQWEKPG